MSAPDPLEHPDDYDLWCELNACTACDGLGEDWIEDEYDPESGEYGRAWVCKRCGGTGIDPDADDAE